jgi:uncharacterized membrane protein YebE (DUF533 family)
VTTEPPRPDDEPNGSTLHADTPKNGLTDEIRDPLTRSIFLARVGEFIWRLAGAIALGLLIYIAVVSYQQSQANGEIARNIESCTTPEGECAKEGSARVDLLVLAAAYAAGCADRADIRGEKETLECTLTQLANDPRVVAHIPAD